MGLEAIRLRKEQESFKHEAALRLRSGLEKIKNQFGAEAWEREFVEHRMWDLVPQAAHRQLDESDVKHQIVRDIRLFLNNERKNYEEKFGPRSWDYQSVESAILDLVFGDG